MIRWGVIGAGRIANRFCDSLQNDERAILQAVSCRTLSKAKAFAEKYASLEYFDNYQSIIDNDNVDAIYISVPHYYHYQWIIEAIKNHKAVLVEKPMCLTAVQVEEVMSLAKENNVLVMEAMKTRLVPGYIYAKELINSEDIGDIKKIHATFTYTMDYNPNSYIFDNEHHQGGSLYDVGVYCVAYMQDFNKSEIEDIDVEYKLHECGVDLYTKATIKYKNGCIGIVESGIDRDLDNVVRIEGSEETMVLSLTHRPSDITVGDEKFHIDYVHDDFFGEIKHFNDLMENNMIESDVVPLNDSLEVAKIIDEIRKKMK